MFTMLLISHDTETNHTIFAAAPHTHTATPFKANHTKDLGILHHISHGIVCLCQYLMNWLLFIDTRNPFFHHRFLHPHIFSPRVRFFSFVR